MVRHPTSEQVAMLDSGEPSVSMSPSLGDELSDGSECESSENAAEILMAHTTNHGPPGYSAGGSRGQDGGNNDGHTDAYFP